MTFTVSDKLEIIGFIEIKDIGSPPTVARHLILPRSTKEKGDSEFQFTHKSFSLLKYKYFSIVAL